MPSQTLPQNPPSTPNREMWTCREAAAYTQLSERTVTYMAQRGELPARRIGSRWRFYRDELENLPVK